MDTPTPSGSSPSSSGGTVDTARQAAHDLADKAKEQAGDLADKARQTATEHLDEGKGKAEGVLGEVAEALHHTGDSLRESDQDAFARYADMAAAQVEQFTAAIRGRSVGDLLDEAEDFARREPALFLGGAFLLGIFGARFLKASGMAGGPSGDGAGGYRAGQTGTVPSARTVLSKMTVPGGSASHQHVSNVNRPPPGPYGADLQAGHTTTSGPTSGTRSGGLSGGHLPANSPAAAGGSSMGTAMGNAPAGADAPVRSGPGASPMSTSPMSGSPGTGNPGAHGTATPPARPAQSQDDKGTDDAARH